MWKDCGLIPMLLQDFVGDSWGHPGNKSNMTTQLTLQTELQQESQTEYLPQLLLPYAMPWILYKYIRLELNLMLYMGKFYFMITSKI